MTSISGFPIRIAQADLDDLQVRLRGTRLPSRETVQDGSQGVRLADLTRLLTRWRDGYDWRHAEELINSLGSSWAQLDADTGIHFLHIRSPHPHALPLLLCHGWPGSILEFRHLVGPLTDPESYGGHASDAFHLVIPSMPGYGFSTQPAATGWGVQRIADAWIDLVAGLGYEHRWAAQGGDWGSAVVEAISRRSPRGLIGCHTNLPMVFPGPDELAAADPAEQAMVADAQRYQHELSAYSILQETRPQAISFALADSPIGQAAWILQLFADVSDSTGSPLDYYAVDELIDDIMLYWLPNSAASSARLYWEEAHARHIGDRAQAPAPNTIPFGFSIFPRESIRASRRWIDSRYPNVRYYHRAERGGHFAALENPSELVSGIRATFAELR